ncbi:hypothetical protein IU501_19440 [Nocardia otitidiscaviarum]|uniref:Uncharacterized protein n=1 Tax=Nocardia otitidiscaviarum TaxID=1823 RepID=A0A516NN93_9NOCA|nr:hypothetical protein [Nocardia otitidiscaviarum]MBF6135161.1 hypothetical protein [Nocardia otitidiscaviarum]MBF6181192.1 hypothetical protein [Nocardia otitidiscaviarum]MBF6237144.1 hypothetical protein [Nocardia otitidiscaviarum]MBF6486983.1 hypothetical protein [Nocardia otitidiscaviarum]MCP9619445.1 hypothetical protein [Nocardia otitidiscaviarum]
MSTLRGSLIAAVAAGFSVAGVCAGGIASAQPELDSGGCTAGSIAWQANGPGITGSSQAPVASNIGGHLVGCYGAPDDIGVGTIIGTTFEPAATCYGSRGGRADLLVIWDNGVNSHVIGSWEWTLGQQATNHLKIVGGLGSGKMLQVVTAPPEVSPAAVTGCIMGGYRGGSYQVLSVKVL